MSDPFKIFICYAREDRPPLQTLLGHIAVFERSGAVRIWHDSDITGGQDWDQEIRFNLKSADIVLLLISPEFFRSDYIHSVELTEALQRDRDGEALVIPVILKKCLWQRHPQISALQALPFEAKPIFDKNHWTDPDDGFYDVAEGLARVLDDQDIASRRTRKIERLEATRRDEDEEKRRLEKQKAEAEKKEKEAAEARKRALPDMVPVKGGTFQMGSNEYDDEKPIHTVTIADFEIGQYPVTQNLWQDVMGNNPSHFQGETLPVEKVSWDEVQDFLKKLNTRFPDNAYRLPTEAEWEFAARGGTLSKGFTYAGSNDLPQVGWYWENSGDKPLSGEWKAELLTKNNCRTHPVGQKKANELDLYDMCGNVWEWCNDWYGAYPSQPQTNPAGPASGSFRVLRGGSWNDDAVDCRVAYRYRTSPEYRNFNIGFRLASSPQ